MSSADRYKESGVDLDAADQAKLRIGSAIASTNTDLALGKIGGFGGMFRLPPDIADPVVVVSTDGVGTKVLVSIAAGIHHSVGEDLVNHCVNDILVQGARPVAFQDYLAAHTLVTETVASIVEGVARGCIAHNMILSGGETAQLPDLYSEGHYDLAGTIVGAVGAEDAIDGDEIVSGDVLVGYSASGLHTNGYTLARKIVFEDLSLEVGSLFPNTSETVADVFLKIHRSYFDAINPTLCKIKGMAHITGGGIRGNLSRTLPSSCGARIDAQSWETPNVFAVLQDAGKVTTAEMFDVFNMGVGMISVVAPGDVDNVTSSAIAAGTESWVVGEVVSGDQIVIE